MAPTASQNQNKRQRCRPEDNELDPTTKITSTVKTKTKKKRPNKDAEDDTPKAFARLMRWTTTGYKPNGLDNGDAPNKKRKRDAASAENAPAPAPKAVQTQTDTSKLKLLPGEKMSDFSHRVDAAIPVNLKGVGGTKKPKKKPIRAVADENTDDWDFDDNGDPIKNPTPSINKAVSGGNNNNKRVKRFQRSPSPFAELKNKRPKQAGINDVVQAPPTLNIKPSTKLRDKTAIDSVPKSSGGLARREVLANERLGILEKYRAMMDTKRGAEEV